MAEMKTHQLVLRSHGGKLRASCQCRASETKHARDRGGGEYYEPFELTDQDIWKAYNNPENHWVEFTEEDKVKV